MPDETALKERLQRASDGSVPATDLGAVARRAGHLRARKALALTLAVCAIGAALAIPMSELRHLGEGRHPAEGGNVIITFKPSAGWRVADASSSASSPDTWTTNVAPPRDDGTTGGIPNSLLEILPAQGIAINAGQWLETENPLPRTGRFHPLSQPLRLSGADSVGHGGFEGLPREDITVYFFEGQIDGRAIGVQVWIGSRHPSAETLRAAQAELSRLEVVPAPPTTSALDAFGMRMALPAGWHGFLYSQGAAFLSATDGPARDLWDERRLRASLGPGQSAIIVGESDGLGDLAGWEPAEPPFTIGPDQICEGCEVFDDGGPPVSGHALYQRTFTYGNRAFDLYVEFGSPPSRTQLREVNGILHSLQLTPHPNAYPTATPGTGTVGEIPEGDEGPDVSAGSLHRRMGGAFPGTSITVPEGWTGRNFPVSDMQQPQEALAIATWAFPRGGYCAPITALQRMPSDGALIAIDGYLTAYGFPLPDPAGFTPWPARFRIDTATPAVAEPCTGGVPVRTYEWSMGGNLFRVHVALGPDATDGTVASVESAIDSFTLRARHS